MKSTDCAVCCESFSGRARNEIVCPLGDCEFSACKTCVRTYILGSMLDPHCMKCKGGWGSDFVIDKLNKSFVNGDYKEHRKNNLLEMEKSKLPDTMVAAGQFRRADKADMKKITLTNKSRRLRQELDNIQHQIRNQEREAYLLRRGREPGQADGGGGAEKQHFLMGCPSEDCRGFLSTSYQCGLCEKHTCSKCLEVTGRKPAKQTEGHVCNEDNVKSAVEIKKTTKACPSCATRVFKIEGCDQMWCTQCKTTFSWKTGEVEKGAIHNPHYYQWMRTQNNGVAMREPGDVACGGLPTWGFVNRAVYTPLRIYSSREVDQHKQIALVSSNAGMREGECRRMICMVSKSNIDGTKHIIETLHRAIQHTTNVDLREARTRIRDLAEHQLERIDFLLGKMTEKEFTDALYKKDTRRARLLEQVHLFELLSTMGIEFFNGLVGLGESHPNEIAFFEEVRRRLLEFMTFVNYYNLEMKKIGARHNIVISQISQFGGVSTTKVNAKELKAELENRERFGV